MVLARWAAHSLDPARWVVRECGEDLAGARWGVLVGLHRRLR